MDTIWHDRPCNGCTQPPQTSLWFKPWCVVHAFRNHVNMWTKLLQSPLLADAFLQRCLGFNQLTLQTKKSSRTNSNRGCDYLTNGKLVPLTNFLTLLVTTYSVDFVGAVFNFKCWNLNYNTQRGEKRCQTYRDTQSSKHRQTERQTDPPTHTHTTPPAADTVTWVTSICIQSDLPCFANNKETDHALSC